MRMNRNIVIRILLWGLCTLIACGCTSPPPEAAPSPSSGGEAPFTISVTDAKVVNERQQVFENGQLVETGLSEKRFVVSVCIENSTDQEWEDVWYELELNGEAQPYIATGILKFASDKMDVTTREKALTSQAKDRPIICGFTHNWNMLLTTGEDLSIYLNLTPAKFAQALNSITVRVNWRGGVQEEIIPLKLSQEDLKLLE